MKYIISGLIIFLLSGNLILKAQDANPIIVDEIIAKVDNYIVLKSDLEGRYLDALANGVSPTPDLKCLILGSMIREKLMVAHAEIDSIIVSDVEVELDLERRISMILQQYNGNEEMLIQYYGKTMEDIRLELRDQVKEQMVVNRMQQFLTEDINVTPSEVRKFFKRIPSDSLPFYDMEVEVAEIVKKVEAGESEYEKARAKLIDIRRRVVNGEDFGEMAKQFSQGPTGPNGGDLGRVKRGSMVPEFEAEALRLKPGEVSMPVKTEFGLHLIKLEERQGNEYHSRHILLIPQ
ncbi:MAG: peptidylprolyl isomerase, partial [Cyclobacteriaceae bacterium]|nr:peptidylprolyl isomerase [Cyclobacteriaceae bacterium]